MAKKIIPLRDQDETKFVWTRQPGTKNDKSGVWLIDGHGQEWHVPADSGNRQWQLYMTWRDRGNVLPPYGKQKGLRDE